MQQLLSRNLIIILLVSVPILGLISPHCPSEVDFDMQHANNLNNQKLVYAFASSQFTLGQGSYGLVKELDWINEKDERIRVAVKRVIVKSESMEALLAQEINILQTLKGVPKMLQMFGCMETTQMVTLNKEVDGKKVKVTESKQVMYIILEKLFASFEEDVEGDDAPIKVLKSRELVDRLKVYRSFAESLQLLHGKRLVHSDLKPANVMAVDKAISDIKLIDFGFTDSIGMPFKGSSPLYKPYEGFMKFKLLPSFDTYAFGISITEMEVGYKAIEEKVRSFFKGDKNMFVKQVIKVAVKQLEEKGLGLMTDEADNLTKIISDCIQFNAELRPTDEKIVNRFNDLIAKLQPFEGAIGKSDVNEQAEIAHSQEHAVPEINALPKSEIAASKISLKDDEILEKPNRNSSLRKSKLSPIASDKIPPVNVADLIDAEVKAQFEDKKLENNEAQNDIVKSDQKEVKHETEQNIVNNSANKPQENSRVNLDNGEDKQQSEAPLEQIKTEKLENGKTQLNGSKQEENEIAKGGSQLLKNPPTDNDNDAEMILMISGGAIIALAVMIPLVAFFSKRSANEFTL